MSNLRPTNDYVIIRPNAPPEKSEGGLILVPTSKDKMTEGTVVAVGPGRLLENGARVRPEIEPGQSVLYPLYTGTEVDIDGEPHKIIREGDLLAVFGPRS